MACLALAFSLSLAALALVAVVVLATMTSPEAEPGPILGLHAGHPLLLSEEQMTTALLGWGRLLALLDGAHVANGFLDREGVEVEQCLHGDRHLLELLRDDMEHLLDELLVGDVITDDTQLAGHDVEAQREVLNSLAGLERDVAKHAPKSLGFGFLDPVGAYAHLPNRFPGFSRCGHHR
jgi:hypothetical protein